MNLEIFGSRNHHLLILRVHTCLRFYLSLMWVSRSPVPVVQEICKAFGASEPRFPLPRSQCLGLSKGKTQPAPAPDTMPSPKGAKRHRGLGHRPKGETLDWLHPMALQGLARMPRPSSGQRVRGRWAAPSPAQLMEQSSESPPPHDSSARHH